MISKVKTYTRRTKSGKTVVVREHSRKTDAEKRAEAAYKSVHPHIGADGRRYRSKGEELQILAQKKRSAENARKREVLTNAASDKKYAKMKYRDAVKAGAPKLSPRYGERISKRMNYGTALKRGYTTVKGINKKLRKHES